MLAFLTLFIYKKEGISYIEKLLHPNSTSDSTYKTPDHNDLYDQRVSLFKLLPHSKDDIIFIGNSITNGGEWNEILNNSNIKDRSIRGENTSGILKSIDKILESKPRKIFLMAGINDLNSDVGMDTILINYLSIIHRIKLLSPQTKLYIQSILPINKNYGHFKPNNDVVKLNLKIKEMSLKNEIIYIDIFSHLLDSSGQLDKKYTNDGVHLLGEGYLVWKEVIEPYINQN